MKLGILYFRSPAILICVPIWMALTYSNSVVYCSDVKVQEADICRTTNQDQLIRSGQDLI